MGYKLGKRSKANLEGVHPRIVEAVEGAIKITKVDFTILNDGGLRTVTQQNALYRRGASKLDGRRQKSKHQKQPSGFGEAVDLVPWVNGQPRWEWPLIYPVAAAMIKVANRMDLDLRWGGIWDREVEDYISRNMHDLDAIAAKLKSEVRAYCIRHPGPDFIDGPHFEMR